MGEDLKTINISYKDIFYDKNFCLYMVGNLISRFGDSIDSIAYGWMVYEITGSMALMALLFGVNAIPTIIFQPIAGVFVDYKKKKNVIIICNLGRALIVTLTAFLFMMKWLRSYHLFIFTFINSTFEAFEIPAGIAGYPLIIDKEKFAYAKSVSGTLSRIVELLGLAIAASIIAIIGLSGGMLINAATFYICCICTALVKFKPENLKKQEFNFKFYMTDLKEGYEYIKGNKLIMFITLFMAIQNILMVPMNSLSVAYVNEELLAGPELVATMNFIITLGMIIGGAIYPKLADRVEGRKLFITSGIFLGFGYVGMFFMPMINDKLLLYILIIIDGLIIGTVASIIMMRLNITFMTKVEQKYLGRAAGLLNSLSSASVPIGAWLVSGLCLFFKASQLFLIFGVFMMILFFIQKYNKSIIDI